MKITIGLTRTERDNGRDYVPAMDGYREGADQDVVVLVVDAEPTQPPPAGWQAVEVGEAYFKATNAPQEVVEADPLAQAIHDALMARLDELVAFTHRLSMNVGDTVQVDDGPRVVCARFGWEEI
jgi:hypothetical protein